MTFFEKRLVLQVMAEERIGAPRYWDAVTRRRNEDAQFAAATKGGKP